MGAALKYHHSLQGLIPGFIGRAGSEMAAEGADHFFERRIAGKELSAKVGDGMK